jgi:lipid II:glycine glycyltransferase (peptidoglycan interpeptide bridge formation enzyme)
MHIVRITDPHTWHRVLLGLPNPHVLQSSTWGEFKSRHNWRVTRLVFEEEGTTVAAASILQRKLPRLLGSILYVPKGPALDYTDTALTTRVLAELEGLACRWKALFIKIDPDVYYPDAVPEFSPHPACAPATSRLLAARGWRFSDEQIQFRNTVLLDLSRSKDELLAAMRQKTRYNTRLAERRGVIVRPYRGDEDPSRLAEALDTFYQLYTETAQRDGFPIRPREYYLDAWQSFLEAEQALLLLAEVKGEAVAGLVLFTFGATAWYMYGASSDRHRKRMPNNLLQWEAIRRAKAAGCTLYDLWGAPEQLDESDPMWGVVRFKLGMGGELARGLGAWDFPVSQLVYRSYTKIMPRYLDWLRSRR